MNFTITKRKILRLILLSLNITPDTAMHERNTSKKRNNRRTENYIAEASEAFVLDMPLKKTIIASAIEEGGCNGDHRSIAIFVRGKRNRTAVFPEMLNQQLDTRSLQFWCITASKQCRHSISSVNTSPAFTNLDQCKAMEEDLLARQARNKRTSRNVFN